MTQFAGKTPIHPFPCPACVAWPSCDVDDHQFGGVLDMVAMLVQKEWPIHLCDTHRPYAAEIIALARAAAFLPVVP